MKNEMRALFRQTVSLVSALLFAHSVFGEQNRWEYIEYENVKLLSEISGSKNEAFFRDFYLFPRFFQHSIEQDIPSTWPFRLILVKDKKIFFPTEKQFTEHFGFDFNALSGKLKKYMKKSGRRVSISYEAFPPFPEFSSSPSSRMQSDVLLAGAYSRLERRNAYGDPMQSMELLVPHLTLEAAVAAPFEEAFQIAKMWYRKPDVEKYAEKAIALGSTAPGVLKFSIWDKSHRMPRYPESPIPEEDAAAIIDWATALLKADPVDVKTWEILYYAWAYSDLVPDKEDVEFMQKGVSRVDSAPRAQIAYAVVLSKTPASEEGRKIIEGILAGGESGRLVAEHAEWLLKTVF